MLRCGGIGPRVSIDAHHQLSIQIDIRIAMAELHCVERPRNGPVGSQLQHVARTIPRLFDLHRTKRPSRLEQRHVGRVVCDAAVHTEQRVCVHYDVLETANLILWLNDWGQRGIRHDGFELTSNLLHR